MSDLKPIHLRELRKIHTDKPEDCLRCRWFLGCASYKIESRQLWRPEHVTLKRPVAEASGEFENALATKTVLLVAMNPGVEEDKKGEILVGPSGKLLMEYVEEYLSDHIVHATNAVKCYAPKSAMLKDGGLPTSQIQHCSGFLKEDIERIKPDLIVALGKDASEALDLLGVEYIHCHHPSYILRGGSDEYTRDMLARADAQLKGELVVPPIDQIKPDPNLDSWIGLDFEWDADTGEVHTLGVALNRHAAFMPYDKAAALYLKRLLGGEDVTIVGHDLARAEIQKALELGIQPSQIKCAFFDSFVLLKELLDHTEDMALKDYAYRHLLVEDYTKIIPKGDTKKETSAHYVEFMRSYNPEVGRVCAADAWTSLYMVKCLREDWRSEYDGMTLGRDADMDMLLPTAVMMHKGIALDVSKVEEHRAKLVELVPRLEQELTEFIPAVTPANILEILAPYGAADTTKETLQDLLEREIEVPFIKKVLEYRKVQKLVSTYLKPLPSQMDEHGIIHSYIQVAGTNNGRPSSSSPNIATIPRRGYNMKDIFMSKFGNEGVLATVDASESEFRCFAYLSQDKWLIEQYQKGVGMHTSLAEMVGIERDHVKTLNFARLYGAGPAKLKSVLLDAGLTGKKLEESFKRYQEATKSFTRWQRQVIDESYDRGYVLAPDGRRGYRLNPTEIANYPVSTFSSYLNKRRLRWLFDAFIAENLVSHIWLDFYDGIEMDIYLPELDTVKSLVDELSKTFGMIEDVLGYGLEVPIPLDFKIHGRNWK